MPIPGTFSWPLAARGKPRRGMLRRAVFSDVQRKALEKMFQKQKYISKPDRKKLAAKLGLKDSQVSGVMVGKGGEKSRGWVESRRGEGGMGEGRAARGRSELQGRECWPEPREQRDPQLGRITALLSLYHPEAGIRLCTPISSGTDTTNADVQPAGPRWSLLY